MKIIVYNCTQRKLIGYQSDVDMEGLIDILEKKKGILCKYTIDNECIDEYEYRFDYIIRLSGKRYILVNSNVSISVKIDTEIPSYFFGNINYVIRRDK